MLFYYSFSLVKSHDSLQLTSISVQTCVCVCVFTCSVPVAAKAIVHHLAANPPHSEPVDPVILEAKSPQTYTSVST